MTPEEQIVHDAIARVYRWMGAFAVVATVVLLFWKGWWYAGGFAVGSAFSVLNFHWLKGGVEALTGAFESPQATAEAVTGEAELGDTSAGAAIAGGPGAPASPRPRRLSKSAMVVRFLLRYALIVGIGYVIFRSSILSVTAFLAGLFVFVAGILAEMIYELATGTATTN